MHRQNFFLCLSPFFYGFANFAGDPSFGQLTISGTRQIIKCQFVFKSFWLLVISPIGHFAS
jgi:hypothetical protein